MSSRVSDTIAVFGGTGRQGGAVVTALLERGAPVRALVRSAHSERARSLAARGVELAVVRFDDPASLVTALRGVAAFSFMTPEANTLEEVEAEVRVGTALVEAAVAASVPLVVFTSVFDAGRHSGVPHHDSKRLIEEHLTRSGLSATMVRPTPFMEELAPKREQGELVVRLPLPGDAPLRMVAVRDVGRVAAALLVGAATVPGGVVELVGDELTGPQIAAAFGAHADLPARYEALPVSVLSSELDRVMFREFARMTDHPTDPTPMRAIVPDVWDLPAWIRHGGWTVPE